MYAIGIQAKVLKLPHSLAITEHFALRVASILMSVNIIDAIACISIMLIAKMGEVCPVT